MSQQHEAGQPGSLQQRSHVLQGLRNHRARAHALKQQGVSCPVLVSAAHLKQAWTPPQHPGKVAGVQLGDIFRNRAELMLVGLHGNAFQDVHVSREGHVLSLVLTPPPDVDPTNGQEDSQDSGGDDEGLGQPPLNARGSKGKGKAEWAELEGAQGVGSGWDGESTEHWGSDGGSGYKYRSRGGVRLEDEKVLPKGENERLRMAIKKKRPIRLIRAVHVPRRAAAAGAGQLASRGSCVGYMFLGLFTVTNIKVELDNDENPEEGLMHFRLAGVPQEHLSLEAMKKQLAESTCGLPQTLLAEPFEAERAKHEAEVKRAKEQWAAHETRWRQLQQADAKVAKKQAARGDKADATDSGKPAAAAAAAAAKVSQPAPSTSDLQPPNSGKSGTETAAASAHKEQASAALGGEAAAALEAHRAQKEGPTTAAAAAAADAASDRMASQGREVHAKAGRMREKERNVEREGSADETGSMKAMPGSKKRGREGEGPQVEGGASARVRAKWQEEIQAWRASLHSRPGLSCPDLSHGVEILPIPCFLEPCPPSSTHSHPTKANSAQPANTTTTDHPTPTTTAAAPSSAQPSISTFSHSHPAPDSAHPQAPSQHEYYHQQPPPTPLQQLLPDLWLSCNRRWPALLDPLHAFSPPHPPAASPTHHQHQHQTLQNYNIPVGSHLVVATANGTLPATPPAPATTAASIPSGFRYCRDYVWAPGVAEAVSGVVAVEERAMAAHVGPLAWPWLQQHRQSHTQQQQQQQQQQQSTQHKDHQQQQSRRQQQQQQSLQNDNDQQQQQQQQQQPQYQQTQQQHQARPRPQPAVCGIMHNARVALLDKQLCSTPPTIPMSQHQSLGSSAQAHPHPPSQPGAATTRVPSPREDTPLRGRTTEQFTPGHQTKHHHTHQHHSQHGTAQHHSQHDTPQHHTHRSPCTRRRRAAPPRCCAYTADGRLAALLPQGLHECEPGCGRHALCARNKQVAQGIHVPLEVFRRSPSAHSHQTASTQPTPVTLSAAAAASAAAVPSSTAHPPAPEPLQPIPVATGAGGAAAAAAAAAGTVQGQGDVHMQTYDGAWGVRCPVDLRQGEFVCCLVGELVTYKMAVSSAKCAPSRVAGCLMELHQADCGVGPIGAAQQQQQDLVVRQQRQQLPELISNSKEQAGVDVEAVRGAGNAHCMEGLGPDGMDVDQEHGGVGDGSAGAKMDAGKESHGIEGIAELPLPAHALPPMPTRPPYRTVHTPFSQHHQVHHHQQQQSQQQQESSRSKQLAKLHAAWHNACSLDSLAASLPTYPSPHMSRASACIPVQQQHLQQPQQQQLQVQQQHAHTTPVPLMHAHHARSSTHENTPAVPLLVVDMGKHGNVGRWIGRPPPGHAPNLIAQVVYAQRCRSTVLHYVALFAARSIPAMEPLTYCHELVHHAPHSRLQAACSSQAPCEANNSFAPTPLHC